ncbi:MAG: hypothetical protein AAF989_11555 [Planctomycetota bacterium]
MTSIAGADASGLDRLPFDTPRFDTVDRGRQQQEDSVQALSDARRGVLSRVRGGGGIEFWGLVSLFLGCTFASPVAAQFDVPGLQVPEQALGRPLEQTLGRPLEQALGRPLEQTDQKPRRGATPGPLETPGKEVIERALNGERAVEAAADPVLEGVLEVIQQRGSLLKGSYLEHSLRSDRSPAPQAVSTDGMKRMAQDADLAEMLLRTARMLERHVSSREHLAVSSNIAASADTESSSPGSANAVPSTTVPSTTVDADAVLIWQMRKKAAEVLGAFASPRESK